MSNIKVAEAEKLVNSVSSYYEAMDRNGWFLPALKSSIISCEYLDRVRNGDYWCPKYEKLLQRPCPRPPPKEFLLDTLAELLDKKKLDFGGGENRVPDKSWLLRAIATIHPTNIIFQKNYLPPVRKVKADTTVVDNGDNFYDNLPTLKLGKRKKRGSLKMYKEAKETAEVMNLREDRSKHERKYQEKVDRIE